MLTLPSPFESPRMKKVPSGRMWMIPLTRTKELTSSGESSAWPEMSRLVEGDGEAEPLRDCLVGRFHQERAFDLASGRSRGLAQLEDDVEQFTLPRVVGFDDAVAGRDVVGDCQHAVNQLGLYTAGRL